MPSVGPVIEDIEPNEALKTLGITRFWKHGSVLQIMIGEKTLLTFDIDKNKVQKTLSNFNDAAIEAGLNIDVLAELKIILPRDYLDFLLLDGGESKEGKVSSSKNNSNSSTAREQGEGGDKENKPASALIAVNLAKDFCEEFFIDILGQPYAAVKVGEHIEVVPIKSSKFKNWLCKLYYDVTKAKTKSQQEKEQSEKQDEGLIGDILSTEALTKTVKVLIGEAEFSGKPRKQLYLRTARTEDGTIYYDLTNPRWQSIKITSEGWDIVYSPALFRRYSHQKEQDIPDRIYSIDIFDNFLTLLNIPQNSDNKLLFKCYIISMFYYGIVHAALMLHGEGGTAKTTLQEFIKMLVDPSAILTLSISFDIESMAQKIAHNYVCYFDNISKISDTISDLLCRAITGSGFLKRELFTDDEDIIYELRYCLGLTGINLAATKSDLLDRGLIIEHKPIYKQNIKRLKLIWKKFYEIRPKLLGYIFDILVKVLKFEKEHAEGLKLEEYPRLADFAEVCEIISRCMGNEPMEFMHAFEKNVSLKHRTAIEDSSVGKAIQFFIKDKKDWEGRMTDLLSHLKLIAISELQIESIKNGRFWPQTAQEL